MQSGALGEEGAQLSFGPRLDSEPCWAGLCWECHQCCDLRDKSAELLGSVLSGAKPDTSYLEKARSERDPFCWAFLLSEELQFVLASCCCCCCSHFCLRAAQAWLQLHRIGNQLNSASCRALITPPEARQEDDGRTH